MAMKIEQRVMTPKDTTGMRSGCCWKGCRRSTPSERLDKGWRQLMLYAGPKGEGTVEVIDRRPVLRLDVIPAETWNRDGVLCPDHVAKLESLLVELPSKLLMNPEGEA